MSLVPSQSLATIQSFSGWMHLSVFSLTMVNGSLPARPEGSVSPQHPRSSTTSPATRRGVARRGLIPSRRERSRQVLGRTRRPPFLERAAGSPGLARAPAPPPPPSANHTSVSSVWAPRGGARGAVRTCEGVPRGGRKSAPSPTPTPRRGGSGPRSSESGGDAALDGSWQRPGGWPRSV